MIQFLKAFWQEEEGQDVFEYIFLLAFVLLVAAAVFINTGQGAASFWCATSQVTSKAGVIANSANGAINVGS